MRRMSYQTFLLALDHARAEVVPERGALLTRLGVDGRELLYMDYGTLGDLAKNVRGGVPVLFPFAGRLPDDRFVPPGAALPEERVPATGATIKQHGFGRNRVWRPVGEGRDHVRLRLESDDATRAVWPWDFVAEQTIRLLGRGVQIDLVVENGGPTPMPVAPGWHPYFPCPVDQKQELTCDLPGFTRERITLDRGFHFRLPAPARSRVRCGLPGIGPFTLEFSARMRHVQLWSPVGAPFVCIEPFWGPAGTVLGPARDEIAPGSAADYWMRIELP